MASTTHSIQVRHPSPRFTISGPNSRNFLSSCKASKKSASRETKDSFGGLMSVGKSKSERFRDLIEEKRPRDRRLERPNRRRADFFPELNFSKCIKRGSQ